MACKSYAVALLVLTVAGFGNCAAVNSELRKLNNRINKRINSLQQTMLQNINNLELNIADLEFENQELKKELEGEKNRTSELEKKMNSASSSGFSAITDTESKDSTVHQELQKIGGMINLLTSDVEHLKSKSHKSTNQLQVTVRKAFKDEKALIRKFNKTLHHKQEEATKEVRDFIAKVKQSLGSHIENIGDLYNTTSNNREALQEVTTKLDNTVAAMADMSIRISRNERLLTAVSDSTVHQELQKIGGMINLLTSDVEHLKNKSHKSTNQLQVTVRKAFKDEKSLIRKFNKTLHHKQEEATKEVRDFIAKSTKSLGSHIENIEDLYNTTSNIREALQEITTKLNNTVAAMADMSIRISPNERLLTAISDCGSHKGIPNGDVYGDSFVGGTPVISCDSGYSQTGSAQCKLPVFWETDVKCQKDCAILHVSHGMVIPDTSVPHGTTVTVTCDSDYIIVGNSTAVCNNGVFTGVPTCKRRPTLTDMVVASSSNYTVKVEDDSYTPGITGVEFLSNGQLVLCDYYNDRMKLLSSDFRMLGSLELQSSPYDVSAVNTTTVLITLPFSKQLQYIHVMSKFHLSSEIQLDKKCWGIDVVGDEIFTSCHNNPGQGEILVLNMEGTLKRRLGVSNGNSYMFHGPFYLTVNPDTGYIYVSDWYADNITCLSSAGDIVYRYGDQELDSPHGIYVDRSGTVIVCGEYSDNVHVITASGKKHRVLLTSSDGLWYPLSVAYRESDATLFICGHSSNNLLVFKLKNNF